MKNPLKYRPLVNQVELNYWNPQPNLITVRTTTLSTTATLNGIPLSSGQSHERCCWKPHRHLVACGKLKKRWSCQLYAQAATVF